MINEIDKDTKATESPESPVVATQPSGSEPGESVVPTDPGNAPRKEKKKKRSSAIAAAAMGRSAVGAVMPSTSFDIRGSSPITNSGPDVSDND
jgi:hypothetical protein